MLAVLGIAVGVGAAATSAGARTHRIPRTAGVPLHIPNWAYDDGCDGGIRSSAALVRRWLSYAESACGPNTRKALTDCHAGGRVFCQVMQYLDTDWDYPRGALPINATTAPADWWLHLRSHAVPAARLFSNFYGGGYLFDQRSATLQAFFRSYLRKHFNSDDGLLMDWQSPSLSMELYYSTCACATTLEIHTDAALRQAHEAMSASLTHSSGTPFMQADVSLPPNPFIPQGLDLLSRPHGVHGLVTEGYPEENGSLDPFYSTLLDQIAYVNHKTSDYVVLLSHGANLAASQVQARRVQEATMLLGYSPGHLVDWADLEQGNTDIAVWPEEGIYPTGAVESMRTPGGRGCLKGTGIVCAKGGHRNLLVARGVYRREFRMCYNQGFRFGPCAAIVNTTGRPVTVRGSWLKHAYGHQLAFNGGDVQSGGSLKPAPFAAGSTKVGAHDAVLLAS